MFILFLFFFFKDLPKTGSFGYTVEEEEMFDGSNQRKFYYYILKSEEALHYFLLKHY